MLNLLCTSKNNNNNNNRTIVSKESQNYGGVLVNVKAVLKSVLQFQLKHQFFKYLKKKKHHF